MTTSIEPKVPQLAPAGAGVGFIPTLFLRYFVRPFVAAKADRVSCEKLFRKVNQKILKEIEGLNEEQMNTRVLVPPQKGLEDSSRYWSIKMVLEHLYIVSTQKFQLIPLLSAGQIPNMTADTALVKPKDQYSTVETVQLFKKLIDTDYDQLNANFKNDQSTTRFKHPWFGPMKAIEWYWLLGMHHGLHLKQIREIKKQLPLI